MNEVTEYLKKLGKKGGTARAKNLTPKERKDSARKAAEARWAKMRELVDDITVRSKALEKRATKKSKLKKSPPPEE
jgi:hypothetical protein